MFMAHTRRVFWNTNADIDDIRVGKQAATIRGVSEGVDTESIKLNMEKSSEDSF